MARIVCVEDEEVLRQDIVEELEDAGYEVIQAANGKEGLEAIVTHNPDLVISDITMPVMDGYQLIEKFRSEYPKLDEIPFIFLSALADREAVIKGISLGSDDYMTKPIDYEMLLTKVEARLRQAKRMVEKKQQEQILLYQAMTKKFQSMGALDSSLGENMPEDKPASVKSGNTSIVLVGEGNQAVWNFQKVLERQGHQVTVFKSGRAYLRKMKGLNADLTCFWNRTDDLDVSDIFSRCGTEVMTRALVGHSQAMKMVKAILKKSDLDKLCGVIQLPCSDDEIASSVSEWLEAE